MESLYFQLEKSREATDEANIRAAYAEVMTKALTEDADQSQDVKLTQKQDGWQSTVDKIGGIDVSKSNPKASGTATVKYVKSTGAVTIEFN